MVAVCFSNASAAPTTGAFIDVNLNGVYDPGLDDYNLTVQGAIDNATPGQTIIILPGTYAEQIIIAKDGLRIVGSGNDTTNIVAFSPTPMNISFSLDLVDYYSILTVQANDVSISNLTVDGLGLGAANAGIGYWNSSGALDDLTVKGINDASNVLGDYSGIIVFTDNFFPVNFRMANSTVTGSLTNDVTIASAYVDAVLTGDLLFGSPMGSPQNGLLALDSAVVTVRSCTFSAYSMGGTDPTGSISAGVRSSGSDVSVSGSRFLLCDVGLLAIQGSAGVAGSSLQGNTFGIAVDTSLALIDANTIQGNSFGVYLYASLGLSSFVSMGSDDINGNGFGVYVKNDTGTVILMARGCGISGNTVGAFNELPDPIDMAFNYWGDATGPFEAATDPAGLGDPITNVSYSPFLTFPYGTVPQTYVVVGTSIQEAIDFAAAGDTILVMPGTYSEQLTMTKDRLSLIGSGNDTTFINAVGPMALSFSYGGVDYYSIITVQAMDVTIASLTVEGLDLGVANAGIGFKNSQAVVDQVTVQGISAPVNVLGDYSGMIVFTDNFVNINFQLSHSTLTGALSNEVTIASAYVTAALNGDLFFAAPRTVPVNGLLALDSAVVTIDSCQFNIYALSGAVADPAGALSAGVRSMGGDVTVTGSQFTGCDAGVLVTDGSATVTGSLFHGNLVDVDVVSSLAVINGNTMPGSTYGVFVYAMSGLGSFVSMNFNDITANSYGVYVKDKGGSVILDARYNNISDNGAGAFNELADQIFMPYNWWGSSTGPQNVPLNMDGSGNNVSAGVEFTPWLDAPFPTGTPFTDVYNDQNKNHVYNDGIDIPYYQIQTAIADAATNEWIVVDHGNYSESITISVAGLQLFGPNFAVDPNTGVRAVEAILEPSSANPTNGMVITVTAAGVGIAGFTITGTSHYLFSGGVDRNGVQSYANIGIQATGPVSDLLVTNNIVRDLQKGVSVSAIGTAVNNVMINAARRRDLWWMGFIVVMKGARGKMD